MKQPNEPYSETNNSSWIVGFDEEGGPVPICDAGPKHRPFIVHACNNHERLVEALNELNNLNEREINGYPSGPKESEWKESFQKSQSPSLHPNRRRDMNDSLGDRMKANYEDRERRFLTRRTYTIIRIDGKAFHTYTKGLKRPFDEDLMMAMDSTAKG